MAFLGGVFGGNTAGGQAANNANQLIGQGVTNATGALQTGQQEATGVLNQTNYNQYANTGNAATNMYANALGLNGAAGTTAADSAFAAAPGTQFAEQQGEQAVNRNAAASGMYGSGNNAEALVNYATGTADQNYNNWMSGLSGASSQGLTAAGGQQNQQQAQAGVDTGTASNIAGVTMNGANASAQEQQQGQMADAASNAQGGANLFSAVLGGANLAQKAGLFSDENAKTDITPLGTDDDTGLKMFAYRYKGDPKSNPKVVGPMAQDVEKKFPGSTKKIGGNMVIKGNWLKKMAA